jgi:hypothetical protein
MNGANIRVVQGRCCLAFTLKTSEGLRIARYVFRQKLQGNKTTKAGVLGFINYSHPPTAESFKHGVVGDG